MVEYTMSEAEIEEMKGKVFKNNYHQLLGVARMRKWNDSWAFKQLVKKHGVDKCRKYSDIVKIPIQYLK